MFGVGTANMMIFFFFFLMEQIQMANWPKIVIVVFFVFAQFSEQVSMGLNRTMVVFSIFELTGTFFYFFFKPHGGFEIHSGNFFSHFNACSFVKQIGVEFAWFPC